MWRDGALGAEVCGRGALKRMERPRDASPGLFSGPGEFMKGQVFGGVIKVDATGGEYLRGGHERAWARVENKVVTQVLEVT